MSHSSGQPGLQAEFAARSRVIIALLAGVLASAPLFARESADPSPATGVVERLHDALLTAMQAENLDVQGRRAMLRETVAESFDVATIVRLSLGRAWQTLSKTERERLEDAQFELILATYAARFDSHDGERFVTAGEELAAGGQTLVRTRIESPGAAAVRLDYLLRSHDAEPRIFNVIADGFSELSMRRAEYTAIFARGGIEALLAEIERLIAGHLQRDRRP